MPRGFQFASVWWNPVLQFAGPPTSMTAEDPEATALLTLRMKRDWQRWSKSEIGECSPLRANATHHVERMDA